MSRQRRFDWFISRAGARESAYPLGRTLGLEQLEDRHLLSVNFTGTYTQDFDSLPVGNGMLSTQPWNNDSTLVGWYLYDRLGSARTTINAGNGGNASSSAGSFYSFGANGSGERALGGVGSGGTYFGEPASGQIAGWIALALANKTGTTIDTIDIQFSGEQWRNGDNNSDQTLEMEYGFGDSFSAVASWITPGAEFNFLSPVSTVGGSAVNGNDEANRAVRGGLVQGNWQPDETLWIRWVERNDIGNDHGLAIDDFSISIINPVNPLVVTTTIDENDGPGVGTGTSLREAIAAAEFGDTITFDPSVFFIPQTITLTQGELVIEQSLTIDGSLGTIDGVTIDANDNSRVFHIVAGAGIPSVTLKGLTITDGQAELGGGIYSEGFLTLENVDVNSNTATEGGGIYSSTEGSLELIGSAVQSNTASFGGGIYAVSESSINQSLIRLNQSNDGGGIFQQGGTLDVNESLFLQNTSFGNGGAIHSELADLTLFMVDVFQNTAGGDGGGIYASGGLLLIEHSDISSNATSEGLSGVGPYESGEDSGSGGGIWSSATTTILGSEISGNHTGDGGHGFNDDNAPFFTGAWSYGGHAGSGGGLWLSGETTISNSIISGNSTGSGGDGDYEMIPSSNPNYPYPYVHGLPGNPGDGGGIYSAGHLTITSSEITGNFTGEVGVSDGFISGFGGYGGGIASGWIASNELTLIGSIVRDNIAESSGGGIWATGTVTLERSWITGNSANSALSTGGVAVTTTDSSTIVQQSTISDNTGSGLTLVGTSFVDTSTISGNSGGGIRNAYGSLTITHSTITDNSAGGGIYNGGGVESTTTIYSSIVAGNLGGDVEHSTFLPSSTFQSDGYNLIGTGNGASSFNVAGDQVIGGASAGLLPLADNGGISLPDGSHILTHELIYNSPAINTGDSAFSSPPTYDQRGSDYHRVAGNRIDKGAYEHQAPGLTVSTIADEVDGDYTFGDLSLREALSLANATPGIDTITFYEGLFSTPQFMTIESEFVLTEQVSIIGLGADLTTISGGFDSRIFNITATTGDFVISGLKLVNGFTSALFESGGAIRSASEGSLTLEKSTVSGNATSGGAAFGGGIYSAGDLFIRDSTVSGNQTSGFQSYGGGIFAGSSITVENSTISGNSTLASGAHGGGLFAIDFINIASSTIAFNNANHSSAFGGGIRGYNDLVTIRNSIIAGNTAGGGNPDLEPNLAPIDVDFSLIGSSNGLTAPELSLLNSGEGNLVGVNPMLGPLAYNGGTMMTHALLEGSWAIAAGDPDFAGPPIFDQRGSGFNRVFGGRIDMGAFEVQSTIVVTADFEGDGDVDGRDFLKWQRGESPRPLSSEDLQLWQEEYDSEPLMAIVASSDFEAEPFHEVEDSSPFVFLLISNDEPLAESEPLVANYPLTVDSAIERLFTPSRYSAYESTEMVVSRFLKRRR